MDAAWLHRTRWRWRGAWLRPAFVLLTVADAVIAARLPAAGDSASFVGMLILAGILNLVAALVLTAPAGWLMRRVRPDLPRVVSRDRAGTLAVVLVTAGFLSLGLANHGQVRSDAAALHRAERRAMSWIERSAPGAFRTPGATFDTYTIEPGSIYRTCAHDLTGTRSYCVVVSPGGVRFAGEEPNSLLAQGTG